MNSTSPHFMCMPPQTNRNDNKKQLITCSARMMCRCMEGSDNVSVCVCIVCCVSVFLFVVPCVRVLIVWQEWCVCVVRGMCSTCVVHNRSVCACLWTYPTAWTTALAHPKACSLLSETYVLLVFPKLHDKQDQRTQQQNTPQGPLCLWQNEVSLFLLVVICVVCVLPRWAVPAKGIIPESGQRFSDQQLSRWLHIASCAAFFSPTFVCWQLHRSVR